MARVGPASALVWLLSIALVSSQGAAPEVRLSEAATLTIWNRPIVVLRASLDGTTPAERVDQSRRRVDELPYESLTAEVSSERTMLGGLERMAVLVGGTPVFGILPQDLDPESKQTLEEAGAEAARRLAEALRARAEQGHLPTLVRSVAEVVGSALLLAVAFGVMGRLRKPILWRLAKRIDRHVDVAGVDLRDAVRGFARGTVQLASLAVILSAIYIWLAFALSRFSYTRPWGQTLGKGLAGALSEIGLGALHAIPGLFKAVLVLLLTRFFARTVSHFFSRIERGEIHALGIEADTAKATRRLGVALIWIFGVIAAYPYLPGAQSVAFQGVSVFVGIMVSLGGLGFVNQVMSGLVVVYARTFRIGDYVRVGDKEGVVSDVGLLSAKIVTRAREEITVPNAVLVGSTVTNYSRLAQEQGAVVHTTVTIGYDAPWRQVHALLERAADGTPGVRKDPRPAVLQRSLSDFYVEYQLLAHIEKVEVRLQVLSDLHASIQDAFNEVGVQIMSPHFESQPREKVVVPKALWNPPPAGRRG
jgi:small-conductance mechanosensitive channel